LGFSDLQSDDARKITGQINELLAGLTNAHPDVAILDVDGVLILLDVTHRDDVVTPDSDPQLIREALGVAPE